MPLITATVQHCPGATSQVTGIKATERKPQHPLFPDIPQKGKRKNIRTITRVQNIN